MIILRAMNDLASKKPKHTKYTGLLPFEARQVVIVAAAFLVVLMTIISMQ